MPRACAAAAAPPPTTVDEGRLWAPAGHQEAVTAANGRRMRVPPAADGAAASGSMGGVRGMRRAAAVASAAAVGRPRARLDRVSLAPLGEGREIGEMWSPKRSLGGFGRAGGGRAVAHGHARGGRTIREGSDDPWWSPVRAQPWCRQIAGKSRLYEIVSRVCGTDTTQIGAGRVLPTP